jgi:Xaa-Pro aminopeptidase
MSDPHELRRARLIERLAERDLAGALISDLVNVRYLTGFTGSSGAVLLLRGEPALFASDGRYVEQASQETGLEPVLLKGDPVVALWSRAPELLGSDTWAGIQRIAVETDSLSHDRFRTLAETHAVDLVSLDRAVQELRTVKDEQEVEALREACAISTLALEQLVAGPLQGCSERQLTRRLETAMLDLGAEAVAFPTILAAGEHSAIPHHSPTDRPVEHGDLLKVDFGARVRGYHADCTRTFVVGAAADWQQELHDAVEAAQAVGVTAAGRGPPPPTWTPPSSRACAGPGSPTASCTGSVTVWGWRSTRTRSWARRAPVCSATAPRSPSSPASICRAGVGCASRTRSSYATAGPRS